MKKILMICESFGGGVFAYVSQLCNDLTDEFEIILSYSVRSQTPKNYKELLDPRVRLIEVPEMGMVRSPASFIKAVQRLRKLEKDESPDLIHLHSSMAGGIGRMAFKGVKEPVVYTPHGYAFILLGPGIKSQMYRFAERLLVKRAITLTCCESEDAVAASLGSANHFYIETGINVDNLKASLNGIRSSNSTQFTVYTLGRACTQKQPALFNQIASLVPEARFLWIGGGELEAELAAPNVELTGWMPREKALALGKGADVFILCSLGEAIAMSLIENMFMGKLILVSDVVGNCSVIKDGINGYVCKTPEDYARYIRSAMKRYPIELVKHAKSDVEKIYNTNIMTKKYITFYNKIIDSYEK